jgi:regulator of replication initiation timing
MLILDDIEKFIRNHFALLREQITVIEREKAALIQKLAQYASEKEVLKLENENLKSDIQNLNAVIRKQNKDLEKIGKAIAIKKQSFHDNLPKSQVDILKLVAAAVTNEENMAESVKRHRELVQFDVEELRKADLIEIQDTSGFSVYKLTQEGRRYLKSIGFI